MGDVLAFFDWEHSANGPTEAINGRLETLRGIALGFRKPRQLHHQKPAARRRLQTRHPNPPLTHAPYTPKSEEPDNLLYDEDATYSAFRPYQQN